jgi:Raf kinase inhibitor-like YbhB/YbcL family protein
MSHHLFPFEDERAFSFKELGVRSSAFKENELIPERFTCDGVNINPALEIEHIPEEAKSLAVIMDDPDAPHGTWVHWVIWNIPVTHHLKEGHSIGVQGKNDFGNTLYGGPCPPGGTHRYFFKVYALDCILDLPRNSNKSDLEKAMSDHILGFGELIGLYRRK